MVSLFSGRSVANLDGFVTFIYSSPWTFLKVSQLSRIARPNSPEKPLPSLTFIASGNIYFWHTRWDPELEEHLPRYPKRAAKPMKNSPPLKPKKRAIGIRPKGAI